MMMGNVISTVPSFSRPWGGGHLGSLGPVSPTTATAPVWSRSDGGDSTRPGPGHRGRALSDVGDNTRPGQVRRLRLHPAGTGPTAVTTSGRARSDEATGPLTHAMNPEQD